MWIFDGGRDHHPCFAFQSIRSLIFPMGSYPSWGGPKMMRSVFFFRFWGNLSRPALQERTKVSSFAGTTNYARENYKI